MSKLRLIQCGVSGFGNTWLENTSTKSPDFDLVALVDIVPAKLQEASSTWGIPLHHCFASLEQALDAVEADAVLTVTPPVVHVEHARLAFARKLHFMTEKPMADTIENAKLMLSWARTAGTQFVVSQNYRYNADIQTLRSLLAAEVVGSFGHGHLDFYLPTDFTGTFRETMEYVLICDMATHHFDLIRHVTGRNITRVNARTFRPAWSRFAHHAAAKVLLELEGGIPFSYCGDWSACGKSTGWHGAWRLQCAAGSLHLDSSHNVQIGRCGFWNENPTVETVPPSSLPLIGQAATLNSFAQAIRTGHPSPISGEDNLFSFATVCAAVVSARESRSVDIAEIIA